MDALNAGKHVLTEKLMAHDITQCKQMIRKAKEKNLLLAVGHQRHYSVLYDNANHIVREGLLGDVKFIRAQWHRNNSFPNRDSWRKADPRRRSARHSKAASRNTASTRWSGSSTGGSTTKRAAD